MSTSPDMRVNAEQAHARGSCPWIMVFGEWDLQQATISYSAASSTPATNKKHTRPQRSPSRV